VVDARDPLRYRCSDLEEYVMELGGTRKESLLLLNKADLLPAELRRAWAKRAPPTQAPNHTLLLLSLSLSLTSTASRRGSVSPGANPYASTHTRTGGEGAAAAAVGAADEAARAARANQAAAGMPVREGGRVLPLKIGGAGCVRKRRLHT
jgi:large subunit GTPase 1